MQNLLRRSILRNAQRLQRNFAAARPPRKASDDTPATLATVGTETAAKGINVEHFKDVFRAPGPKFQQRRYRYRWDWHLRMFLMSLIPPASLWTFLQIVKWALHDDYKAFQSQMENVEDGKDQKKKKESVVDKRTTRMKEHNFRSMVEKRILQLEGEVQRLRQENQRLHTDTENGSASDDVQVQEIVLRAKRIAGGISRVTKDTDRS